MLFVSFGFILAVAACIWWRRGYRQRTPVWSAHLRGRLLRTAEEAAAILSTAATGPTLQIGRLRFPIRVAGGHFAFVGATGSGKTMLQRLLMQSVLPEVGQGRGVRALVYDAKQDVLSILGGMRLRSVVQILNPLDSRSVAWDMASDITSPASALQVATGLIPPSDRDTNPFFTNAARHLLFGVLLHCIQQAEGRWSFRQVLLVLRDAELLRRVLGASSETQHLLQYCAHEGTFQNILSTVLTVTSSFEIIAAAWDRAGEKLSLRRWVASEGILMLGNDEMNRAALDTINRLLFQRLSELMLGQSEVSSGDSRRTWIFLDEVREMGRLEGLPRLLTKGRSKGVSVAIGFQDVAGLQSVYGREIAEEVLGQCSSKVILRLNSAGTARWASQLFGSREILERSRSENRSRSMRNLGFDWSASSGEGVSNGIRKRELVLDSEFLDLPEPTLEAGLSAYFLSPITGGFLDRIPGSWMQAKLLPRSRTILDHVPRPEAEQYLRPWSDEDSLALGLTPDASAPSTVANRGRR
ncbi:MAG: type IV secretion system DNA-binding domain-containing protein [Verrucomicrobiota bacterium]